MLRPNFVYFVYFVRVRTCKQYEQEQRENTFPPWVPPAPHSKGLSPTKYTNLTKFGERPGCGSVRPIRTQPSACICNPTPTDERP